MNERKREMKKQDVSGCVRKEKRPKKEDQQNKMTEQTKIEEGEEIKKNGTKKKKKERMVNEPMGIIISQRSMEIQV